MLTPFESLVCATGLTFCRAVFAAILLALLNMAGKGLARSWQARRERRAQRHNRRALYARNLRRI